MAWPQADGALQPTDGGVAHGPAVVLDASTAGGGPLIVPGGEFLLHADYVRQGPDLMLVGQDGTEVLVVGFFSVAAPPALEGDSGLRIDAQVAAKLAGPAAPGQYAQVQPGVSAEPVARVQTIDGEVVAIRADGQRVLLAEGSFIFQGDVLQTGPGAALALIYIDGMTMQLDQNTRMVIDQLFYNAEAGAGAALFSLVKGAFLSLSGEIAKLGQDTVQYKTPTGTIGVRGTNMAASHVSITKLVLLENPDKSVGALIFTNDGGFLILDQVFASLQAFSAAQGPSTGTTFASRADALAEIDVSARAIEMYDRAVGQTLSNRAELLEQILVPEAGTELPIGNAPTSDVTATITGFGIFSTGAYGVTLTPLNPTVINILEALLGSTLPKENNGTIQQSIGGSGGGTVSPPPSSDDDANVTGNVSIEQDGGFGSDPTDGGTELLLTTENDGALGTSSDVFLEGFLGLSAGSLDALAAILDQGGQSVDATSGSAFMSDLSISVTAGDVLTFDYNFLTDEVASAVGNDFAFVVVEGQLFPLADTNSPLAASNTPFARETGFQQITHVFQAGGTFAFAAGVVDVDNQDTDSGLLLDNLRINGASVESFEGGQDFTADAGNDVLAGGPDDDVLAGGLGEDFLTGGGGADRLAGGPGADLLTGGRGARVSLTGGAGADRFEYQTSDDDSDILLADLIEDFEDGTDLIQLAGGLAFGDLTIDQTADVAGGASNDTVISISATARFLAILVDIDAGTTIDVNDFVVV